MIAAMDKNVTKAPKEKFFNKWFWISAAISVGSLAALGGIIAVIEYFTVTAPANYPRALHISMDAVALSGLLGLLVFVMSWLSSRGAFDFLAYSVKLLFTTIFKASHIGHGFPETYFDYKTLKDSQERKPFFALLFVSLLFICAGFILLLAHENAL